MPRRKLPPYTCPRCGYQTGIKYDMKKHCLLLKAPCPTLAADIQLTHEVVEYVLANREYRPPPVEDLSNKFHNEFMELKQHCAQQFALIRAHQHVIELVLEGHDRVKQLGVTDITTDEFHAEIEEWDRWKDAFGRLFLGNRLDKRDDLRLYLYGAKPKNEIVKAIVSTCKAMDVGAYAVTLNRNRSLIQDLITKETVYKQDR